MRRNSRVTHLIARGPACVTPKTAALAQRPPKVKPGWHSRCSSRPTRARVPPAPELLSPVRPVLRVKEPQVDARHSARHQAGSRVNHLSLDHSLHEAEWNVEFLCEFPPGEKSCVFQLLHFRDLLLRQAAVRRSATAAVSASTTAASSRASFRILAMRPGQLLISVRMPAAAWMSIARRTYG